MNNLLIFDKTYKGQDYTQQRLPKAEYEDCIFDNCLFSQGELTNITFTSCEFIDCDLSNANIAESTIKESVFKACKILGVNFFKCNDFLLSFTFEKCTLNFSSFYKLKLKNSHFNSCKMIKVDFTETDLTGAILDDCDLETAIFSATILEKTDFSTAYNFTIDPEDNKINKAKFSKDNLTGLLTKYKIEVS
jgi:uncharacterized protein YjbI with pentapeptide repeats